MNYKLSWESYKNNLSNGFSKLQQMQEFVDVTLAASGHLVKAHQNIIALASPYLKYILKSTPCQHPVIFLGPINHSELCLILEYIYTGEVNVPSHLLPGFVEAAKQLHIEGIKDIQLPQIKPLAKGYKESMTTYSEDVRNSTTHDTSNEKEKEGKMERRPAEQNDTEHSYDDVPNVYTGDSITSQLLDDNDNCDMDLDFQDLIQLKSIPKSPNNNTARDDQPPYPVNEIPIGMIVSDGYSTEIDNRLELPSSSLQNESNDVSENVNIAKKPVQDLSSPLYTVSNRGSLQMVMNRYVYNMHHKSYGDKKRRWRCINYRSQRCMAYVDTNDGVIENRKNLHSHAFHDREIFKIGRRKPFFTSITEASISQPSSLNKPKTDRSRKIKENTEDQQQKQIEIEIQYDPIHIINK